MAQVYSFVFLALFVGIGTLMALCGCTLRCFKGGRTCVYIYGTLLLPIMLIFLSLGVVMTGFV